MATYRISNLIDKLAEIMNDGYELVEIMELEEDGDLPTCLSFNAMWCIQSHSSRFLILHFFFAHCCCGCK